MHVLNVNSSIDLRSGGGTAERTSQMSRALAQAGVQCTILTLDIAVAPERVAYLRPAVVVALPCLWRRFNVPEGGWAVIKQLVDRADIVHLMGHWSILNVLVYYAARRSGTPYVVCPAGALPLFGRSRWLKRLYNFVVGRAIVRNAAAWIAVTAGEFPHFAAYGVEASKVAVIPNGVNEPAFKSSERQSFFRGLSLPDVPFILFMGRLNPIKGPDLLLDAFALVSAHLPMHHLIFAGPDGGMLAELQVKAQESRLAGRIHFLGHVDGDVKDAAYHFADMLVVPSRQEAMSIVVLEAGVCGTPVLVTDQCGFDEITEVDPRLMVPATSLGLATGMLSLLERPKELRRIGGDLREFVKNRYVWSKLTDNYTGLYRRVIGAAPVA
jgi:glycosyltransferase involved in cell wall biosynthesis